MAFDVKYDSDNTSVFSTYNKQFDDIYWSGAKAVEDNWYNEDYEYLAPLFIRKGNLPEGFIILRVDEPTPYDVVDNQFGACGLCCTLGFNTRYFQPTKGISDSLFCE